MKRNITYSIFLGVVIFIIYGFQNPETLQEKKKFVVVLDAGHGGHDSGNRGNGYEEKTISLNVVLSVGKALEKDPRFKVVYTRKTDNFIELHERGSIANKAGADLFVSVHCNSHRSQAYGTETFVLGLHANDENFNVAKNENSVILLEDNYEANYDGFDPNSPESIIGLTLMQEEYLDQSLTLASFVQNRFKKTLSRKSRGVKQAGFVVLHQTYMPSVLIELGFLTNNKEGKFLNSKKGQAEMAKSIVTSIIDYKESLDAIYYVPKTETPKVVETKTPKIEGGQVYEDVVFKVQIAAGSTDIELQPFNFNGLDQLSKIKSGDLYKYYFGSTSNYTLIQELKEIATGKGYDSSFIAAFRNNEAIPLTEALKANISSN
ncbi:N-acetylmuramoyl-L-alanine amidase [Aquimarina sp. AD10]|uniref:N-acetylmuramoyl-L-alanine amidase n=1 Tax=Aquimarina aggregata TaxID=1642818 RepID=A0A163C123_9FLAO|nr:MULTISPECIES: N-acetylmuramoyl-L-alanine amidase [Aquimarina]AXT60049.1 N-acetylmuramoyl-L-alanine amidase [Aquimarina sp. AD10]KZS41961.1 N-acetylmuramoyl-L-alanine amidase [Aquimarina aggregata]RKM96191.1 N-acetylmuramoyl-L-alanine amidase [Aquimarina sp. AD10]